MTHDETLTDRQRREIEFHRDYAARKAEERLLPVNFDVIEPGPRRPHNAFWTAYDRLLSHSLERAKVLVPGCGFGEDAIRIARLGADVSAFDISPDILAVTRRRLEEFGYDGVTLGRMSCEALEYPDDTFDHVFIIDILHHVDIPAAVSEIRRVLKPGGRIIGNELYTHSAIQKNIRESWIVEKALYPMMRRFIYGDDKPYITEDEHKIDEHEFRVLTDACAEIRIDWFNTFMGRIVPDASRYIANADRALTKALGDFGRVSAGRVVFDGVVDKA